MAYTVQSTKFSEAGRLLHAGETMAVQCKGSMAGGQCCCRYALKASGIAPERPELHGEVVVRTTRRDQHGKQHALRVCASKFCELICWLTHIQCLHPVQDFVQLTWESTNAGILPQWKRAADDAEAGQSKRSR